MVFNLRQDAGERNDLANRRQDVAQRLRPMLIKWEQEVDAEALVNEPEAAAAAQAAAGRAFGVGPAGRGGAAPAGRPGGAGPAGRGAGGRGTDGPAAGGQGGRGNE
jgi:hypothetical protein